MLEHMESRLREMWTGHDEDYITHKRQQIERCMQKYDHITCFQTNSSYTAGDIDVAILDALLKGQFCLISSGTACLTFTAPS